MMEHYLEQVSDILTLILVGIFDGASENRAQGQTDRGDHMKKRGLYLNDDTSNVKKKFED